MADVTSEDEPLRLSTFPYVESNTIAGDPTEVSVYDPVESVDKSTLKPNRVPNPVVYD